MYVLLSFEIFSVFWWVQSWSTGKLSNSSVSLCSISNKLLWYSVHLAAILLQRLIVVPLLTVAWWRRHTYEIWALSPQGYESRIYYGSEITSPPVVQQEATLAAAWRSQVRFTATPWKLQDVNSPGSIENGMEFV